MSYVVAEEIRDVRFVQDQALIKTFFFGEDENAFASIRNSGEKRHQNPRPVRR